MTNQARPCVCSAWAAPALILATPDPGNHPFPSSQWLWRVQNQMWAQMLSVWETGGSEERGHLTSSCFTSSPSPLPTPALFLSSLNPFAPGVCFCAPCSFLECRGIRAKQAFPRAQGAQPSRHQGEQAAKVCGTCAQPCPPSPSCKPFLPQGLCSPSLRSSPRSCLATDCLLPCPSASLPCSSLLPLPPA